MNLTAPQRPIPKWLVWLALSAGLHALVGFTAVRFNPPERLLTVPERLQSAPLQVALVRPPKAEAASPPPQAVKGPPSLIGTEAEQPVETLIPPEPGPLTPAQTVQRAEETVEPELIDEPQDPPQEQSAPSPKAAQTEPQPEKPPACEPPPPEDPAEPTAPAMVSPAMPSKADAASPEQTVGGEIRERGPAPIVNPAPHYPRMAVARGMMGTVWLEVDLSARGQPKSCRIIQSSGYSVLDRQAKQTILRKWQFPPSSIDPRTAVVSVDFTLR